MNDTPDSASSASSFSELAPILPELAGPDTVISNPANAGVPTNTPSDSFANTSDSSHTRQLPAVANQFQDVPAQDTNDPQARSRLLAELFEFNGAGHAAELTHKKLRLGHFEIERLIGSGGMGAVFRANDSTLQRTVALKVLTPKHSRDMVFVKRFLNEARSCARLNHENIARIFFVGEDRGVHFIAFEFVDGTNLLETIRQHKTLQPVDALNVSLQIAFALVQTARAGVIHRDIKPSNIILTTQNRAKLVDLGLARKDGDDSLEGLTVAGATLGTFDYISPEQARDARNVDVRSDIYSLGCTLFHMLTGVPPYQEGTPIQKLLDHQDQVVPEVTDFNPGIDRDLSALVRRMMNPDPEKRHQSPEELIHDLMLAGGHRGLHGIHPDGLIWMKSEVAKEGILQKYAGLIATLALVVVLALFVRSGRTPESIGSVWPVAEPSGSISATVGPIAGADVENTGTAGIPTSSPGNVEPASTDPTPPTPEKFYPLDTPFLQPALERLGTVFDSSDRKDSATSGTADPPRLETTPPDSDATTVAADEQPPIIIRGREGDEEYATIESAVLSADDGDVIVLQYNGRRLNHDEVRPLRIADKGITIRGATGFRPLIRFKLPGRDIEQSRMITLIGGRLELVNLDVEFVVPETSSALPWSLISLQGTEKVRLNGVNILVENTGNQPATMFELMAGSAARLTRMNADGSMPDEEFSIGVNRCWVGGVCDMFNLNSTIPGDMDITNSAIVVDGNLINYRGDSTTDGLRGRVDLRTEHVTCVLGESAIRLSDSDILAPGPDRNLLPLHVMSNNNIFVGTSSEPLVRLSGNNEPTDLRDLVVWSGNKNSYDDIDTFLQIDSFHSEVGPMNDDFESWKSLWAMAAESSEIGATFNEPLWRSLAWKQLGITRIRPTDLLLATDPPSNALGGATDGGDIGADMNQFLAQ